MNPIEKLLGDRGSAHSTNDSNADICFLALSEDNRPSVRTLVLRDISENGITLFINHTSPKWRIIGNNRQAELLIWYPSIQKQYRITGEINELDPSVIAHNWVRRPKGSKYLDHAYESLGPQSTEIASREVLVDHINALKAATPEDELTTPASAAGVILVPQVIEILDLNNQDRIHDRRRYHRDGTHWTESILIP